MKGELSSCQIYWNIQVLFHLLVAAFVGHLRNILTLKIGLNFKVTINIYPVDSKEDLFAYHRY